MNKEIQRQWVAALRSGEYKQGHGVLESNGRFCCLGVLCDLAVKAGVVKRGASPVNKPVSFVDPYDPEDLTGRPPMVVEKWAGLDAVRVGHLIRLNDIERLPFDRIANIIEEVL